MPEMMGVPGCCDCTAVPKNYNATVNGCDGLPEAGAAVTVRNVFSGAIIGQCTTGTDGKCGVTVPTFTQMQTTMQSATYTARSGSFQSFGSAINHTFSHPYCVCIDTWPTTLHLTDPWGTLVLTKSTLGWEGGRWIRCQGVADKPVPPDTCETVALSEIDLFISYLLQCISSIPAAIRLSASWPICGTRPGQWIYANGMNNPSWGGGTIPNNFVEASVSMCTRHCSDPPDLHYTLDLSAVGQSALAPIAATV